MVTYRANLDVPRELVAYLAGLLARQPPCRRHPGRDPGADLAAGGVRAVWFRERRPFALVGNGLGISVAQLR